MDAFIKARHFLEQVTDLAALEAALLPHAREANTRGDNPMYDEFMRDGSYDNEDDVRLTMKALILGVAIGAGMGRLPTLTFHVPPVATIHAEGADVAIVREHASEGAPAL